MPSRREQLGSEIDKQVKQLIEIVSELDQSGQAAVSKGISSELTEAKKKSLMGEIKNSAIAADAKIKGWVVPAMAEIYVSGLNEEDRLLKKFNINTKAGKLTVEVLKGNINMQPHLEAVNALISDAYLDFGTGITTWVKGNEHIMNDAIRKQIQSKISLGRLSGEAVRDIKKEVMTTLKKDGAQVLIDRGGREWSLDRYSEMLTRTHLVKANTQATINRSIEFGVDIVEVSNHRTLDPLCQEFEGKIYSLSGRSKNYKKLPYEPPFHPNCKHTLLPRPDLE